jgi:hypothetical protein
MNQAQPADSATIVVSRWGFSVAVPANLGVMSMAMGWHQSGHGERARSPETAT